ncbi:AbrB/MazE/SpoVT family DNA-binding domain-containing protein [Paenibacillus sp. P22]|uniref:AbrB/MazE/SpoVT family DNA-binding domain-containing protein n=1 Tax=Paenibacillus sp. P22 TaxID=483908 RepID=UPI0009F8A1AC|nr:AbrB/MazE/SpoVT family DNA-binding domain-containing protein [Paenibacillus sp. P22]
MKSTGITRKVDDLGRIVIPKELRDTMEIAQNDSLEVFTDGGRIVLQKYKPGCTFCGSLDIARGLHGRLVCGSCMDTLRNR